MSQQFFECPFLMTIQLVILLLVAMLSPPTWLVPSNRQHDEMALRLEARCLGLAIQLARQDRPHWLENAPLTSCAQFHCPRRRDRRAQCYWQNTPTQWPNQWREPCAGDELLDALYSLPRNVYKVEATAQFLALCWGRHGDSVDLGRIAEFLRQHARGGAPRFIGYARHTTRRSSPDHR